MRVILLNGPPRSGKDTLADEILARCRKGTFRTAFAQRLKVAARGMLPETRELAIEELDARKDEPLFGPEKNVSWRQILIRLGQNVFRPLFGDEYFGRVIVNEIKKLGLPAHRLILTDAGFIGECKPIVQLAGPADTMLIWLDREGCSYVNDSRSTLDPCALDIPLKNVHQVRFNGDNWQDERRDFVDRVCIPWLEAV